MKSDIRDDVAGDEVPDMEEAMDRIVAPPMGKKRDSMTDEAVQRRYRTVGTVFGGVQTAHAPAELVRMTRAGIGAVGDRLFVSSGA